MKNTFVVLAMTLFATVGTVRAEVGVTKDTIKIGVFAPLTGSASIFGRAAFGAEAVYREANAKGGIHGRQLEIVREDDACDAARTISAVRKMTSQDQVFMLHGGVCSGVVMAVRDDLERQNIPFVVLGAASAGIVEPLKKNLFQPIPNSDVVARQMVDFAMSKPSAHKIALISHTDEWGKTNSEVAIRHLREKYHVEVVANVAMERGSTDATPQILQIKGAAPDAVLAMLYPAETAILVRDAHKYGMKSAILGNFGVSLEDTRDRVRNMQAMNNFYTFYAYAPALGSAEMEPWTKMITKYYPDHRADNFSYEGMGGALAVIEALKRAGPDLTREKFIAAMNTIQNFNSGILNAPITFSANDHAGVKGGAMITYRNGKAVVLRNWAAE
jgi:branched-chain amino acid transport system substrate-binding protein